LSAGPLRAGWRDSLDRATRHPNHSGVLHRDKRGGSALRARGKASCGDPRTDTQQLRSSANIAEDVDLTPARITASAPACKVETVSDLDLNSGEVHKLQNALTEAVRASEEGVQRFIEPADGTLRKALSKRPHLIFGRRGSGKTSLLRKAIAEHNLDRRPSAFVDLEPFKGHTYPDVLISVLMEFFRSLQLWLDEGAVARANQAKVWRRWFSQPRKKPLSRETARAISADVAAVLVDLEELLHSQDDVAIERRLLIAAKDASQSQASVSVSGPPVVPVRAGLSAGEVSSQERTEEVLERLRRSKANYLHVRIPEFQRLLKRVVNLADADGLLILDDLYYIRRADQPFIVDYFHRLTKNQRLWLKVGTIRHRSSWYVRGDPAIGTKLGDDADEINLDITLEKYQTARTFLTRVFGEIAEECDVNPNDLLTEGAVDRLVLASGGVARDFLSIANKSLGVARERGSTYRGTKVNAEDVNQACGEHEGTKREELSSDASDDESTLIAEFERIRRFCLEEKHVNCFLVEKDLPTAGYGHIQELVDLRLLHLVKSRVTVKRDKPGKIYEAYLLDLSQYTGERKKRDIKIIEFWKTGAEDELRRTALIYTPS
jgi:hypothetical protein